MSSPSKMPERRAAALALPLAVSLALSPLLGCFGAPIGVQAMDASAVHRKLVSSSLSGDIPSAFTRAVLTRNGFEESWARDPEATLERMRSEIFWDQPDDALFALAELSFVQASSTRSPEQHLAAALYAYAFLFSDDTRVTLPQPFDPRVRLASDIYNRGLTGAFRGDGQRIALRGGPLPLPFGSIDVAFDEGQLRWGRYQLTEFAASADFDVSGLRNRYRRPGLGAPLAAATRPLGDAGDIATRVPPAVRVPVTALLQIEAPRQAIRTGSTRARLRLYASDVAESVELHGQRVPLEVETTSALASTLAVSRFWETETGRFFGTLGIQPDDPWGVGLVMLHPYRPDRTPVVLVHGTRSSPGRWAELINELTGIPFLRQNFQVWLFSYKTGQPVNFSAGLLREALERAVAELDPDGDDQNLRRMVVIGHSQGGLLAKLTAVDSGDAFYRLDTPFEDLKLTDRERHVFRRTVFFEPLPFVKRVVFIATPHRGSFLADRFFARPLRSLVRMPLEITELVADVVARNPDSFAELSAENVPTSLDNMSPNNWFLESLVELPVDPAVSAHSIIAVRGDGPYEEGNDGVVEYRSAHLEGVVSERVVRSGHSTQSTPETMVEVARILLSHETGVPLDEIPGGPNEGPGSEPASAAASAPPVATAP